MATTTTTNPNAGMLAAAAAGGAAAAWCYLRRPGSTEESSSPKDDVFDPTTTIRRPLNHVECHFQAVGMEPIATVTWCEGDDAALEEAVGILKQRAEALIEANPWVGGRLSRSEDHLQAYLDYPRELDPKNALEELFLDFSEEGSNSGVHHEMTIADFRIPAKDREYTLAPFRDFSQPLWRIAVVRCSRKPSSIFGIIVSMSHFVGDGHTYYHLYNALMDGSKPPILDDRRLSNAEELQSKAFTPNELHMAALPGIVASVLHGTMVGQVYGPMLGLQSTRKYMRYFLVDEGKIEQLKAEELERAKAEAAASGEEAPAFVSTNDILTSWFLGGSGHRHGIMATNLRGRIPEHKDDLAGCYLTGMYFRCPEDTRRPSLVRGAVKNLRRVVTGDKDLGRYEMMTGGSSLITTWAGFCTQTFDLGNSTNHLLHLPSLDCAIRGGDALAVGIVFRASPTRIGVAVAATQAVHDRLGSPPFELRDEPFPVFGSGLLDAPIVGLGPVLAALREVDATYLLNRARAGH